MSNKSVYMQERKLHNRYMKHITQTYYIKASKEKVWQALVDQKIITKWGGGPAKMSEKTGPFSLWGGDIHGKNVRVVKEKELVQDWYGGDWEEASIVEFKLSEKNGTTRVTLAHKNIPDTEAKDIAEGWKDYYMVPLKELVEENS